MQIAIIGTSGQLATELRQQPRSAALTLLPAERFDVSDRAAVFARLDRDRPKLVLNAAAYTAVDRAESERERAFAVNAEGPRWLAEWCAEHDAALIHVSTDYVFDGRKQGAYVESDEPNPLGVYGASKLAGELAVREVLERHVIVRTSWVFSAHGHNFLKTMLRLADERDELRVVDDQHGRPTAAGDLARALLGIAERLRLGDAHLGTTHFAGAEATTWCGFARAILEERARLRGRAPTLIPITSADYPTPAPRPANSVLDSSSFERSYGVAPRPWRHGMANAVRALLEPSR